MSESLLHTIFFMLIFIFIMLTIIILIGTYEKERSKKRENLLQKALKDRHLDIEVRVANSEVGFYVMFFVGAILFCALIPNTVLSILEYNGNIEGSKYMTPIILLIPLLFIIFFWPFPRKGRLVVSSKMIFLPVWTLRILTLKPTIFRVENITRVKVHRKKFSKKIDMITFGPKVFGWLKLSRKDYSKYEQVLERLKELGLEIE